MTPVKRYIIDFLNIYRLGKKVYKDKYFKEAAQLSVQENLKKPRRSQIINYLLKVINGQNYLEIGVRNPNKNFNKIECSNKYSVDPGFEYEDNPVDFKMTSDVFFEKLKKNELEIDSSLCFDVIFIDGLHIANQVERDIINSLDYLNENGILVLHDCNPPTEFHQREEHGFMFSPARSFWNGTTWKAFYKFRHRKDLYSACFDCDWGIGIISKKKYPLFNNIDGKVENEFYEFSILNKFRNRHLNLISFVEWKEMLN